MTDLNAATATATAAATAKTATAASVLENAVNVLEGAST
jgi:hypothetical protein